MEIEKMCHLKTTILPLIMGTLGMMKKWKFKIPSSY